MEVKDSCNIKMAEINEKLDSAISILIVLETDLSAEHSDEVHLNVVKAVHGMLNEVQKSLSELF